MQRTRHPFLTFRKDPQLLARLRRSPRQGPRLLFFSGGTALRELSTLITTYTHNSVHIVTPFDSGGSSAVIRHVFDMLAVGDLRNRLLALADRSCDGYPAILEMMGFRFPLHADNNDLLSQLERMISGRHPLTEPIPAPARDTLTGLLGAFLAAMPRCFDLRGASIGNLVLAGGFLSQHRHIEPVIRLFSSLVQVRGVVRPVLEKNLHLAATLHDGSTVIGQHLLTGKETRPLASPIRRLFLTEALHSPEPVRPAITKEIENLITRADLICYPIGSFYTSLVANLLPAGVGRAISRNPCPKVFVPNLAPDPEQIGMTLESTLKALLDALRADCDPPLPKDKLLDAILIDARHGTYPLPLDIDGLKRTGMHFLETELCNEDNPTMIDAHKLLVALLHLV